MHPLKSNETSGLSSNPKNPFISQFAAFLRALFIDSILISFSVWKVRSTQDPVGLGTLIANPSSFHFRSGITSAVAFAAQVVVGMILSAALRDLRRSLCGASSSLWSQV